MKYNINNENISKLFLDIQRELENKNEILKDLQKIDNKYCIIKIDLEEMINILNKLKLKKIDIKKEQKINIRYNGNPLITLNLSLLAILTKSIIILDFDNFLGVNSLIIKIVNDALNKFETEQLIFMNSNNEENIDKIICIDDISKYNYYLRNKTKNVKFYSFNYLDFYSDSDEFEEIEELIYKIAKENQIPIESYSELSKEEAVQIMKNGLGRSAVVLTNNIETKKFFEENLKDKKLYINKNPFENNISLIDKDIIFV